MIRLLSPTRRGWVPALAAAILSLGANDLFALNIRAVTWNVFNHPNDSFDEGNFEAILAAINSESVNGLADGIDILALQETDDGSSQSVQRTLSLMNSLGTGVYESVFTMGGIGGDETALIYDASELTRISSSTIGGTTHPTIRAQFRPLGGSADDDLWVYSAHLRSGTSSASTRASEMSTLLSDIQSLPGDPSVLLAGDFNVYSESESAYQQPLSSSDPAFRDPWVEDGNAAWSSGAFSQDSGTPDDRFDLHFASSDLFDDALGGWEYADGSYHPFGNGSAYTSLVPTLVAASDHLPVVADYVFSLIQGLPGDFNGDLFVDVADYTVWRDNFGSSFDLNGNGVGDGTVDELDYDLWRSNLGRSSSPVAVPEPAGLLLFVVGVVSTRWRF